MDLLTLFGVMTISAFVTGTLAKRKGRTIRLWAAAGGLSLIIALIGLAFFKNLSDIPVENLHKAKTNEKIFCNIVITIGILNLTYMYI
ncbi:MAG: hypothetical protein DRQ58_10005 [Gammaproteobacteria bacterium]|nr:MAG: hypothetical protein DRQ58_10005 [Gammaproteobacteria bacterium]